MAEPAKNYLGIDYGHARIGLAMAGIDARLAAPFKTLEKIGDPLPALRQIVAEHDVGTIVIGLPRGLDGQETSQTKAVRSFAAALKPLSLSIEFQDEAGTSGLARERLGKSLVSKADIDSEAAAIILQDYLNNLPVNAV